jgi:hypothetical protein
MDERVKSAFEFARECVTQLIGLSTGVVALTITFSKDVARPEHGGIGLLMAALGTYLLAILCGVAALMNMTGVLQPKQADAAAVPSVWARGIRIFVVLQAVLFSLATLLIVAFGMLTLLHSAKSTAS